MLHVPVIKDGQNRKFIKFWKPDFIVSRLVGIVNVELHHKSNPRKKVIVHINRVKKQFQAVQESKHSSKQQKDKADTSTANLSQKATKGRQHSRPLTATAHSPPASKLTPPKPPQAKQAPAKPKAQLFSRPTIVHKYNLRPRLQQ